MALGNNMKKGDENDNSSESQNEGSIHKISDSGNVTELKTRIAELEIEREQALREVQALTLSLDKACIVSETDFPAEPQKDYEVIYSCWRAS